jgi:hypothetical protein
VRLLRRRDRACDGRNAGRTHPAPCAREPKLAEWNRTLEPRARYDEVMKADNLFEAAVEN